MNPDELVETFRALAEKNRKEHEATPAASTEAKFHQKGAADAYEDAANYIEERASPADADGRVREVKLVDADLMVHVPPAAEDIHRAIEEALGAKHVDGYHISETYVIEEY